MADGLSDLYQDLLTGSYDCIDRIILNAYFRMGHSPGGFHVPLDLHYQTIRASMLGVFQELGIAA